MMRPCNGCRVVSALLLCGFLGWVSVDREKKRTTQNNNSEGRRRKKQSARTKMSHHVMPMPCHVPCRHVIRFSSGFSHPPFFLLLHFFRPSIMKKKRPANEPRGKEGRDPVGFFFLMCRVEGHILFCLCLR